MSVLDTLDSNDATDMDRSQSSESESDELLDEDKTNENDEDEIIVDVEYKEDIAIEEEARGNIIKCIIYKAVDVDTRKLRIGKCELESLAEENNE